MHDAVAEQVSSSSVGLLLRFFVADPSSLQLLDFIIIAASKKFK